MILTSRITVSSLLTGAQDALANYLDAKLGSSVTDHKIFEALSRKMEKEFMGDMRALNVGNLKHFLMTIFFQILDADKLTRVSEYIEPIIAYIQKIISNGFA